MPNWKKVAISGSNVSQFNNDGTYVKMNGSTANGVLTYQAADCAAVESNITYDGSTQRLVNNGQILNYSGSYTPGQEPAIGSANAANFNSLLPPEKARYTPTGSKNSVVSITGRHSTFGSGGVCGASLSITSQVGNSSKNATTQLTSIGKENGCHDAIFTIGLKCDDITPAGTHPVHEMFRLDARDRDVTFSGSLLVQPTYMSTSASLDSVLVYDNATGEIKKSTLTPSTSTATPGGGSGNVQYNNGASGFSGESAFTYNESTNSLTVSGCVKTSQIAGNGGTLTISDGGNDQIVCLSTGDNDICMGAWGGTRVEILDGETKIYESIVMPNLTTTSATTCPSVVISAGGELLAGPVGGAGASTLQEVTTEGNTTSNPIIFDGDLTTCNLIKAVNCSQGAADGIPLKIEGSDNSGASGKGGCIHICAGDATSGTGGNGGDILLKAGTTANTSNDAGYVCVEGKSLVVPDGFASEPGIAFAGDANNSLGLYRSSDCVVISRDSTQGTTTNHYFGPEGYKICDGALAVGNISVSTTTGRIDASNDIVAYSTSDCRLKKYVKPIKNALDKIDQIRGVEFDWKVTDEKMEKEVHSFEGHDVGVIAQEIEAVLPEVVTTRDSGYKAVRYDKIVPLLIQGIKELKDEVEILKSKI